MQIEHNISLLPHNTFGMDVQAGTVITYADADELSHIVRTVLPTAPGPILHIGEGSNLLFMGDFSGTILMCANRDIDIVSQDADTVTVRVGAGWRMDDFIHYAISHGWYGLENLSLIPGQVGASAVQNIGAYGVEAGDCISRVHCISLEDAAPRTFTRSECAFSYRHSIFKDEAYRGRYAVVAVEYRLGKQFLPHLDYGGIRSTILASGLEPDSISAGQLRDIIIGIRQSKLPDPRVQGNAGSFFMNPIVPRAEYDRICSMVPSVPKYDIDAERVKIPAAWLIEQCGWKGRHLGAAGVHSRQPLVLVNLGGATGGDIKALSDCIRHDVRERFGIDIRPEVMFV